MEFERGSVVRVKEGVLDPDYGTPIGGWVGRVEEVDDEFRKLAWDAETLAQMGVEHILTCEADSLPWGVMVLKVDDLEPCEARDTPSDVESVADAVSHLTFLVQQLRERREPETTAEAPETDLASASSDDTLAAAPPKLQEDEGTKPGRDSSAVEQWGLRVPFLDEPPELSVGFLRAVARTAEDTLTAALDAYEPGEQHGIVPELIGVRHFHPAWIGGLYYAVFGRPQGGARDLPEIVSKTLDWSDPLCGLTEAREAKHLAWVEELARLTNDTFRATEIEIPEPDFEPDGWRLWQLPEDLVSRLAGCDRAALSEVVTVWRRTKPHFWSSSGERPEHPRLKSTLALLSRMARSAEREGQSVFVIQATSQSAVLESLPPSAQESANLRTLLRG